jgi:hypothetical protein
MSLNSRDAQIIELTVNKTIKLLRLKPQIIYVHEIEKLYGRDMVNKSRKSKKLTWYTKGRSLYLNEADFNAWLLSDEV